MPTPYTELVSLLYWRVASIVIPSPDEENPPILKEYERRIVRKAMHRSEVTFGFQ